MNKRKVHFTRYLKRGLSVYLIRTEKLHLIVSLFKKIRLLVLELLAFSSPDWKKLSLLLWYQTQSFFFNLKFKNDLVLKTDICTNDTYHNNTNILIPTKMLPEYMTFENSLSQILIWRKLKNPTIDGGAVNTKDVKKYKSWDSFFFENKIELWQILLLIFNFAFEFLDTTISQLEINHHMFR